MEKEKKENTVYDLDFVIQNARRIAKRDGRDQTIVACPDGSYCFCREAYGRPTVPVLDDEEIIGHVVAIWGVSRIIGTCYERSEACG